MDYNHERTYWGQEIEKNQGVEMKQNDLIGIKLPPFFNAAASRIISAADTLKVNSRQSLLL